MSGEASAPFGVLPFGVRCRSPRPKRLSPRLSPPLSPRPSARVRGGEEGGEGGEGGGEEMVRDDVVEVTVERGIGDSATRPMVVVGSGGELLATVTKPQ